VLSSPSIALDASKVAPDPDTKVEDWIAVACSATLTPWEKNLDLKHLNLFLSIGLNLNFLDFIRFGRRLAGRF
jgi:hypothetical protein